MKKNVIAALALLSTVLPLNAETVTGFFAAGTSYEVPGLQSPALESRMFARVVAAGESSIDLPVSGGSGVIVWTAPISKSDVTVKSSLTTPRGSIGATERRAGDSLRRVQFRGEELGLFDGKQQEVIHVENAPAGTWRLRIEGERSDPVSVVVAEPDSTLVMRSWTAPLSRQPDEPVRLFAELRHGEDALTGAIVRARLAPPDGVAGESMLLFDDATHGDAREGDGIYSVLVTGLPPAAGQWSARFEAEGSDLRGARFARTGSGEFISEPGNARIVAGSAAAKLDRAIARISVDVEVQTAGLYRLDVIVAEGAAEARSATAWGEKSVRLEPGETHLAIDVPIAASSSTDLLFDLRLLGLDAVGVAGRETVEIRSK